MHPAVIICVGVVVGMVMRVAWTKRFHIWCWWAAAKAGCKAYPNPEDRRRQIQFIRAYAKHLLETRYQIRAMRGIR